MILMVHCSLLKGDLLNSIEDGKSDEINKFRFKKNQPALNKSNPNINSVKKNDIKPQKKKNEKGKNHPVHFQGMSLTGLKSEGIIELHKNVKVTQNDFVLESQEAKIFLLKGDSDEVKRVEAEGNVKMAKTDEKTGKLVRANGDSAEFDNLTQIVTLKGKAVVVKGEDVLSGNIIFYNLKTGWIKVEKVKGVVNP